MATITETETIDKADPVDLPSDALYEVIDGLIVEKPQVDSYPVEVASILQDHLGPFVRQAGLGRSIVEILFRIDPKTQYRPDVAFISHEKWPIGRRTPKRQPWEIVPDLAIEVISESDEAEAVLSKTRHYFQAGVRAVWLVFPSLEVIHVFDSFTNIRALTRSDMLEGGNLIPGFVLPLETLFAGVDAEATDPTA